MQSGCRARTVKDVARTVKETLKLGESKGILLLGATNNIVRMICSFKHVRDRNEKVYQ